MDELLIFLATGAAAGVMAGLFGVGGGMIMVPALMWLLPARGVAPAITAQVAIGTSLAVIAATSLSSLLAHHRHGAVRWPLLGRLTPGLATGAVFGALIADQAPSAALRLLVAVGALATAVQMGLDLRPRQGRALPGAGGLFAAGGVIGTLSSLIGIGGGSLTVPYLVWCSVPIRQAVATAAGGGVPIAWAGAVGFMIAGWDSTGLPGPRLGYVSLTGFAGLAVASTLAAPWGARLAHRLPERRLKQLFAGLLSVIGLALLIDDPGGV